MIVELYIEQSQADVKTDLASLLTFAIDDLKNFASRQTTFSKTIVLPGTDKNNRLFGNVFDVSIANDYNPAIPNTDINFNPSVSAACIIFQNYMQVFKGRIRLMEIVIDGGHIEYEVSVSGELTGLNVALSSGLLEDLDFSAYDHYYTTDNIIGSWNNPGGSGYYYPHIDYGKYSINKHDWDIRTFRPALYVKEYIDKMFAVANYRYDSALFNTTRFKNLIIPHNQKELTKLEPYNLFTGPSANFVFTNLNGTSKSVNLDRNDIRQDYTYDATFMYYTYTGADFTGIWDMSFSGAFRKNSSNPFEFRLYKNSVIIATVTFESFAPVTLTPYSFNVSGSISLTAGDIINIACYQTVATDFEINLSSGPSTFSIKTPTGTPVVAVPGDAVSINTSVIPRNVKQIDFLTSIIKLFNLYVYEDATDERLIHITPYVDFYSASSQNSLDWSNKIDRSKPIRITPMSELNSKTYIFKYKADSDYYNDLYNKRYNSGYGSYTFNTNFEFTQQSTTIELIFAATPLVGYSGQDKVYSTILKINNGAEDRTDSVIRILQAKKITGVVTWDITDGATVLTSITDYGYAGHFSSPDAVTDDLNFGATYELFFALPVGNLSVNQFNVYWSSYMAEITDKDSKMLTAKINLKPADILNLDFSKYIYVDGVIYRIYQIEDYNLIKPDLSNIKLLKVINTIY